MTAARIPVLIMNEMPHKPGVLSNWRIITQSFALAKCESKMYPLFSTKSEKYE